MDGCKAVQRNSSIQFQYFNVYQFNIFLNEMHSYDVVIVKKALEYGLTDWAAAAFECAGGSEPLRIQRKMTLTCFNEKFVFMLLLLFSERLTRLRV